MTIELPSMLAFDRKLETSDALMYSGIWGNGANPNLDQEWHKNKIDITKRKNRSTISPLGTKLDDMAKPNPISSDSDDANLPQGKDTLKVEFTLRVIGNLGKPFACNDPSFETAILGKVNALKGEEGSGLKPLAFRYAYNIANGRFLWRNRVCADKIQIQVTLGDADEPLEFNAHDFSLNNFDKNSDNKQLNKLAEEVQKGLCGDDDFVFIKISAYVKLGDNQHVFPSQEMNMGEKKKVLFKLNDCAAIHNVKIGNALRTIDTWYGDEILILTGKPKPKTESVSIAGEVKLPIAVEPFGAVTQRGTAYRPQEIDLYSLMRQWVNDREMTSENKNYVVANLIRGGVFGGKSEE